MFTDLHHVDAILEEFAVFAQRTFLLQSLPSLTLDDAKANRQNVPESVVSGQTASLFSLLPIHPLKSCYVCLNPFAPPPPIPHFTSQHNPHSASIRRKSTNSPLASHIPHTDTHAGHKQTHKHLNRGLLYVTHTNRMRAVAGGRAACA